MTARPARNTDRPIAKIGDTVRLLRRGQWKLPDGTETDIPAGTLGELLPWHTDDWGKGSALKLEGYTHPVSCYFPMALVRPNVDGYPHDLELVRRKGE